MALKGLKIEKIDGPDILTILLVLSATGIGVFSKWLCIKILCGLAIFALIWLEIEINQNNEGQGFGLLASSERQSVRGVTCQGEGHEVVEEVEQGSQELSEGESEDDEEEDDSEDEEDKVSDSSGEEKEGADIQDPRFGRLRCQVGGTSLPLNASEPIPFENDSFVGVVLFLVRTEPKCPIWGDYLETHGRYFELQMQGQVKRTVRRTLNLGAEVTTPLQMGLVTQTIAKGGLRFISTINKGLHYSMGDKGRAVGTPNAELPHCVYPLRKIMDRLVITPPGGTPPPLGQDIKEDAEAIKARKASSALEEYFDDHTYTFSFQSKVLDFTKWEIANVPGVSGTNISSFIGKQPIQVVAYTLTDGVDPNGKHRQLDKEYLLHMKLSFDAPVTQRSFKKKVSRRKKRRPKPVARGADNQNRDSTTDVSDVFLTQSEVEEAGDEPDSQICAVRSGEIVPLVAIDVTLGAKDGEGYCCLSEGLGPAVLRQQGTPAAFQLIKLEEDGGASLSQLTGNHHPLVGGDIVLVRFPKVGKFLAHTSKYGLTWVSDMPKTSRGHFYIIGPQDGSKLRTDTQFWLGSCSKANYQVGYSSEGSAKYGGRPLYLVSMDEEQERRRLGRSKLKLSKRGPLSALAMCVLGSKEGEALDRDPSEASASLDLPGLAFNGLDSSLAGAAELDNSAGSLSYATDVYDPTLRATVPAWIEIMHRQIRKPYFAYLVCVMSTSKNKEWTCIRTGGEMSKVMQMCSMGAEGDPEIPGHKGTRRRRTRFRRSQSSSPVNHQKVAEQNVRRMNQCICSLNLPETEIHQTVSDGPKPGKDLVPGTDTQEGGMEGFPTDPDSEDSSHGDARIPVAQIVEDQKGSKSETGGFNPNPIADGSSPLGTNSVVSLPEQNDDQLNALKLPPVAPDQTSGPNSPGVKSPKRLPVARTVPASSPMSPYSPKLPPRNPERRSSQMLEAHRLLCGLLLHENELDGWFLQGGSAEVGVVLPSKPRACFQGMVCRAIWESHWREEWMVEYSTHLAFFSSASKKANFGIAFDDVIAVEKPPDSDKLPLPGVYMLKLHTLGRVSYLCFATADIRDTWAKRISEGVANAKLNPTEPVTLWSDPRECFTLKGGPWKDVGDRSQVPRLILNSRRMKFDVERASLDKWQFPANLLKTSFSPELSDFEGDSSLIAAFLDDSCRLKHLNLDEVDVESTEALCFFVNLYHALLKHALLILGPPSSRSEWNIFFLSASYEVGEEVFSLVELEYCVIRGRRRPQYVPRRWPSPPNPNDEHYRYALVATDTRMNFLLNNGSQSNPTTIRLVSPESLDSQLNAAISEFVEKGVKGDAKRRVISLPQVCEVFGDDFGGGDQNNNAMQCLRLCLHYVPRQTWEDISVLLDQDKYQIKFTPLKQRCHASLKLVSYSDET